MNFTTFKINESRYFLTGIFDCLAPSPLTALQALTLPIPEGTKLLGQGLFAEQEIDYTLPWSGEITLWCALVADRIYPITYNAPPLEQSQLGFSLPDINFSLRYNNIVAEKTQLLPITFGANQLAGKRAGLGSTFPASAQTPLATKGYGLTVLGGSEGMFGTPNPPRAWISWPSDNFANAWFYEMNQDSVLNYGNGSTTFFNDAQGRTFRDNRNCKICYIELNGSGVNNSSQLVVLRPKNFRGAFNSLTVSRSSWGFSAGFQGFVNVPPYGALPDYYGGGGAPLSYMFLVFMAEVKNLEG